MTDQPVSLIQKLEKLHQDKKWHPMYRQGVGACISIIKFMEDASTRKDEEPADINLGSQSSSSTQTLIQKLQKIAEEHWYSRVTIQSNEYSEKAEK